MTALCQAIFDAISQIDPVTVVQLCVLSCLSGYGFPARIQQGGGQVVQNLRHDSEEPLVLNTITANGGILAHFGLPVREDVIAHG